MSQLITTWIKTLQKIFGQTVKHVVEALLTCSRFRMDSFISLPFVSPSVYFLVHFCLVDLFGLVCVKCMCQKKNVQSIFPNNIHFPISASVAMAWSSSFLVIMASLYLMNLAIAKNPCKTEVSVPGMALKRFVFKKVPVSAPHVCDITCERETICQSYNYVIGEKSCELNTRTKEARPENFQPDDLRFYMGRISGRSMYPV